MPDVTVSDAAKLLNISEDAIRRRLQSQRLRGDQGPDGRWIVHLPDPGPDDSAPQSAPAAGAAASAPAAHREQPPAIPHPIAQPAPAQLAAALAAAQADISRLERTLYEASLREQAEHERSEDLAGAIVQHEADAASARAQLAAAREEAATARAEARERAQQLAQAQGHHRELLEHLTAQAKQQATTEHELRVLLGRSQDAQAALQAQNDQLLAALPLLQPPAAAEPAPEADPAPRRPWWRLWFG